MELITTNLPAMTEALFNVAEETIGFVIDHPICLTGMILWVFVTGCSIVSRFVKGV